MLLSILVGAGTIALGGLHDPASVTQLTTGYKFTEGPVWLADGTLLFSDIPANRIYTGTKDVFRDPSGNSNGLTLDKEGRLIAAEHSNRRVTRTEKDGSITVLADNYQGKKFNSPNDVIVRSDGMIFFTDPPYGLEGGIKNSALGFSGLYALDPKTKSVALISKDFNKPNGLCLSPDEKTLYVADTEGAHSPSDITGDIWAFTRGDDGAYSGGRQFCQLTHPDGIKADVRGNVWATCKDGVNVYSPEGKLLETVKVPEGPANCAFGAKDGKTLYITARTSVYTVKTFVEGIYPGGK
ncbi:MAG: SMP-30/gluconolactonase/LRE family protein [Candidatus Hydrogenedentes bacterium]|nr:SMP-30/gluconolactonase/LRE family protein [Candidatus Hydrogenedentota bacterium]